MCCTGQEIQYKDIMPPELQNLRRQLAGITSNKISQGATATPLPPNMPISAPVNPASMAALNMMMGMMGQGGYTQPPFMTYGYGQQDQPFYRNTPPDTMIGNPKIPTRPSWPTTPKRRTRNPYTARRG